MRPRRHRDRRADAWVDGLAADSRRANDVALLVLLGPAGIYAGIAIVNVTLIGAAHRTRQRRLIGATRRDAGADPADRPVAGRDSTTTAGLVPRRHNDRLPGLAGAPGYRPGPDRDPVDMTIPWLPLVGVGTTVPRPRDPRGTRRSRRTPTTPARGAHLTPDISHLPPVLVHLLRPPETVGSSRLPESPPDNPPISLFSPSFPGSTHATKDVDGSPENGRPTRHFWGFRWLSTDALER